MGREIRRVPSGWEHPKNEKGHYRPLYDKTYRKAVCDYVWLDLGWYLCRPKCLDEWFRMFPERTYYRPRWKQEPTHYQIYETVSEGSPVSPVFANLSDLEGWLVTQGYSESASRRFAAEGWCPSLTMHVTPTSTTITAEIHSLDDAALAPYEDGV